MSRGSAWAHGAEVALERSRQDVEWLNGQMDEWVSIFLPIYSCHGCYPGSVFVDLYPESQQMACVVLCGSHQHFQIA